MSTDAPGRRRSFDRDPHGYLRGRPPYPARVYDLLTTECGLGPGSRVLEIGAGPGTATAELLARGAEVVAVEPGAGLAALLRERLGGDRLTVIEADFETARLPPGRYDLIVAATALHWLDLSLALPKIAERLASDGWLAVWWTSFGPTHDTEFRVALDAIYARYLPNERREPGRITGPLDVDSWSAELRRGGWFGPVRAEVIPWTHQLTPARARDLWATFPNVNELDPAAREGFLDGVARTVTRFGGLVADPHATVIYRTQISRTHV